MKLTEEEYDQYLDDVPEAPDMFAMAELSPTRDILEKIDNIHRVAKEIIDDYGGRPQIEKNTGERLLDFVENIEELSGELLEMEEACSKLRLFFDKYVDSAPDSIYGDD